MEVHDLMGCCTCAIQALALLFTTESKVALGVSGEVVKCRIRSASCCLAEHI